MPEPPIATGELERRRSTVMDAMEDGLLVLDGARASDDAHAGYRQDSDFYYLTGVEEPSGVLLLVRRGSDRTETLFLPPRGHEREVWTGRGLTAGGVERESGEPDADRLETMERTGFRRVLAVSELEGELRRALARAKVLYAAPEPVGLDEPLGAAGDRVRRIRERHPGIAVKDARPLVAALRMVKSPAELARIERAVSITCDALREAMAAIRPGQWEHEVSARIDFGFRIRGAHRNAFPCVVGSGPNSCVLHYGAGLRRIEPGDVIVMDVGAEYGMYAADVTRTVPADGRFTPRQREVYAAVRRAQDAALAKVRPGARLRQDVHAAAVASLEKDGLAKHFLHGTSHYLGLDVHDVSVPDVVLAAGMVITVEPGAYLKDEAIGIRIEDDVVVTESGHRVLSDCVPREPGEIESLMAGAGGREDPAP